MLYQPKIPESLLRVSGIVATDGGLVTVDAVNVGSQAPAALINGAGQQNFSKWFEVKGRELTLLVKYTKSTETNIQFGFVIFGSGSVPSRDYDYTTNVSQSGGVTATNVDQKISGISYTLNESSETNVVWTTVALTATGNIAIPVHLGVKAVAVTPSAFPGRYARLVLIVGGTPVSGTAVSVDLCWSGV